MIQKPRLEAARGSTDNELLKTLETEDYLAKLVQPHDGSESSSDSTLCILLSNHRKATLSVQTATALPPNSKDAIFHLFEENMREKYLQSKGGYHPDEKKQELFDEESRFILIQNPADSQIWGFTSFRFDTEDTANDDEQIAVVYCYEVQVDQTLCGIGLGRLLMRCLETLARSFGLQKVMLTVFESNTEARKFYRHLNYEPDEICPSKFDYSGEEEKPDYLILSRTVRAKSGRNKKKKQKPPE